MIGAQRAAARAWRRCKEFEHLNGTDANTPDGMRARATLWNITGRKPRQVEFEAVLDAIHESHRIAENRIGLWQDGREVWPNDADYDEARMHALKNQHDVIVATVQALLGDNTP